MYKSLTKIQIDNSVLSHHIISRAAGLASQGRIIPHVHKTDLFGVLTFTKLLFLLSCLSVCFTFLDSSPSIKGDNMWSTCTNTHWVQGLFWLLQRSVAGTQLSDQGASHLLKETEMLIIHLIMAICLEKAAKKNGSVAQEEISSNCRRGSWREVIWASVWGVEGRGHTFLNVLSGTSRKDSAEGGRKRRHGRRIARRLLWLVLGSRSERAVATFEKKQRWVRLWRDPNSVLRSLKFILDNEGEGAWKVSGIKITWPDWTLAW